MIENNGHKWKTLNDKMYVSINNKPKKVVAVYAGNKKVYPIGGMYIDANTFAFISIAAGGYEECTLSQEGLMTHIRWGSGGYYGMFASAKNNCILAANIFSQNGSLIRPQQIRLDSSYTLNNKTVYYVFTTGSSMWIHGSATNETDPEVLKYDRGLIAWSMIYNNCYIYE